MGQWGKPGTSVPARRPVRRPPDPPCGAPPMTPSEHLPDAHDTASPPDAPTASDSGRDSRGRFTAGNRGGPGNPFARRTVAFHRALDDRPARWSSGPVSTPLPPTPFFLFASPVNRSVPWLSNNPIRVIRAARLTLHGMSSMHSDRYRLLVRRLKEARKRAGLTQVQVAGLLGKPQSFISKIEQCERRLDPIELLDITSLYKAPLADLLSGLDQPRPGEQHERARRQGRRNRAGFATKGD